jgi:hypothetical protein
MRVVRIATVKPDLLMDELLAAIPALIANPGPKQQVLLRLQSRPMGAQVEVTMDVPGGVTEAEIDAVIAAHDPNASGVGEQLDATRNAAKSAAGAIPNWATWTEAQAVAWINSNVVDQATVTAEIAAMARLLVALRNETWPDMQVG